MALPTLNYKDFRTVELKYISLRWSLQQLEYCKTEWWTSCKTTLASVSSEKSQVLDLDLFITAYANNTLHDVQLMVHVQYVKMTKRIRNVYLP